MFNGTGINISTELIISKVNLAGENKNTEDGLGTVYHFWNLQYMHVKQITQFSYFTEQKSCKVIIFLKSQNHQSFAEFHCQTAFDMFVHFSQ